MDEIINRLSDPDSNANRKRSKPAYTNINTDAQSLPIDFNTPLNFRQWLNNQSSIDPNNQYALYLQYVILWYDNKVPADITSNILQTSYLSVLKSLALSFRDEIEEEWIQDLKFTNDFDVLDSIEYYSRKLKEIAIYYINKRETAQTAKLRYNLVGTNRGLQELFESYILKAFTQREYILNTEDSKTYTNLPVLSSITDSAKITMDQYYDLTPYYDKSPTLPVSGYFNTADNSAWLAKQNITIDPDDLFKTGMLDNQFISSPVESIISLSSISDTSNAEIYSDILRQVTDKFTSIATDQLQVFTTLTNTITTTYNFTPGNNWFYWPSGEHPFEQDDLDVLPIKLIDTDLINAGAFAGDTYQDSDRIFVTNTSTNLTQAAWLKSSTTSSFVDTMSAVIEPNDRLFFKFPYPGYGVAAPSLDWTGPELSNINVVYNYSTPDIKRLIENAYFNDSTVITSDEITPIPLNNTNLVDQGANSGKTYDSADRINRRVTANADRIHDTVENSVYTNDLEHSWLYDFTHTNISMAPGQTRILWPYIKTSESNTVTFTISSDVCNNIELSAISPKDGIIGATAGQGLYDSDIIYKLDSAIGNPTQCAFLSGYPLSGVGLPSTRFTDKIIGTYQPGLYLQCMPGIYSTFIWCGPGNDTTLESINIKYHAPAKDSEFLNIKHESIHDSKKYSLQQVYDRSVIDATRSFTDFGIGPGIGDWKTEQYRTPLFSPIGHLGDTLDEYDKMADIVFVDWQYPEQFSFDAWRDADGNDYKTSPDFAWYKLDSNPTHPDVGFGPGKWVNYDGSENFRLKQGLQYKYLRATLGRTTDELQSNNAVPYLIVKHTYENNDQYFNWVPCTVQTDGTWLPGISGESQIVFEPGNSLLYDHAETNTYCISTVDTRGIAILDESDSFVAAEGDDLYWTSYKQVPKDSIVAFNWPDIVYDYSKDGINNFATQSELSSIDWTIISPVGTTNFGEPITEHYDFFNRTPGVSISFELNRTGMYQVSAKGYRSASSLGDDVGDNISYSTKLFEISSVDNTFVQVATGGIEYGTINSPNIAIDLCIPLSGWNSQTHQFDGSNYNAAKPFWVNAYDDDTDQTRNKGTNIYGTNLGFVDQYNVRTQPDINEWTLNIGDAIEYTNIGDNKIHWFQDIEFERPDTQTEWKKIEITQSPNPLNEFMCESADQLIISATDVTSDITLTPYTQTCKGHLFINYYSQNNLTWSQVLSTEYTGSNMVVTSSVDSTPVAPWANLVNRHYPTIATVQDTSNIIPAQNIGLFKPSNLGFSIFLTKSHTPVITSTNDLVGTYRDITSYETDYGFTLDENNSLVNHREYDAQWMKYGLTTIQRAGEINDPRRYLKFTPYMTTSEIKISNNSTVNFELDPWNGPTDSKWASDEHPVDYRGVEPIETWYSTNKPPVGVIYQYGDDVYGNKYYLYKDITTEDLYEQKFIDGQLWVKTIDGRFGPAVELMSEVYDNYKGRPYYTELIYNRIKNIYCFADIMVFVLEDQILFERIQYNYNSNTIFSIVDDSTTIDISNALFGDIYTNLVDKQIHVCITNNNTVFEIYRFDMESKELSRGFPSTRTTNLSLMSQVTSISGLYDTPLFTFNPNTENYNVSLYTNVTGNVTGYPNNSIIEQHLISVNLYKLAETYFDIKSVDILQPNR